MFSNENYQKGSKVGKSKYLGVKVGIFAKENDVFPKAMESHFHHFGGNNIS